MMAVNCLMVKITKISSFLVILKPYKEYGRPLNKKISVLCTYNFIYSMISVFFKDIAPIGLLVVVRLLMVFQNNKMGSVVSIHHIFLQRMLWSILENVIFFRYMVWKPCNNLIYPHFKYLYILEYPRHINISSCLTNMVWVQSTFV